ncbi:MAG TPA: hypothetical protein VLK84_08680 [Longimicrobium sp.]|nr:hypothetical protein [Longimicrobium sp.]
MVMIGILAALVIAGIAALRLFDRALDAGHLLVLRAHAGAVWLFERDGDGRYNRLPPSGVPGALRRFACGVRALARARADA